MPPAAIIGGVALGISFADLCLKIAATFETLKNRRIYMDKAIEFLLALQKDRMDEYLLVSSTMKKSHTYDNWEHHVNTLVDKVKALREKHEKVKANSTFEDPLGKLNRKMKRMSTDAVNLYNQTLEHKLVPNDPQRVVLQNAESITEYPSLQNHFNAILAHLKENGSKGVTIYGEYGVGKTMILKNLNDHEDSDWNKMFDLVIWVDASKSCNEMQKEIAARLNIDMNGADNYKDRIKGVLRGKKYLLLLHNVEKNLNVEEIIGIYERGVPVRKIVLTSTSNHILDPPELVSTAVNVLPLNSDETKTMFCKYLNVELHNRPGMEAVANYSFGKPYNIKKLASTINNAADGCNIDDFLKILNEIWENNDAVSDVVRKILETFCEQLPSPEKECFLYCTLYPGDSNIDKDHLFDCWRAESLCIQRERAWEILDYLKEKSYLQQSTNGPGGEYVRMEKHVWDVALKKLLDDNTHPHLVKAGELQAGELQAPIPDQEWDKKKRISLVNNGLQSLPQSPNSPTLSTLFLQQNESLSLIPNTFFDNIGSLKVLNLHNTGISKVPSSLKQLEQLKVFYLNDCSRLEKLPTVIGELGGLEVLDIRGKAVQINRNDKSIVQKIIDFSAVEFLKRTKDQWAPLPNVGLLRNLRRLLVSFNPFDNVNVDNNVLHFCKAISSISSTALEELVIVVNADKAECYNMMNDVTKAVAPFENLKCLKFIFKNGAEAVINVGCSISSPHQIPDIDNYRVYLKVRNQRGPNAGSFGQGLSFCDAFELVNHGDLNHLSEFGVTNFKTVKGCWIEGCENIKAIADGDDPMILGIATAMLPEVQQLYIKNLRQMQSLWMGKWKTGSLDNLKILILTDLPSLTTFGTDASASEWPALEVLEIEKCPNLKQLPFKTSTALKLRSIKASRTWWDGLTWAKPELKRRFDRLYSSI